ncbi:hypothetical protein E3N88_27473 [Mikania micrantha]|uniref:Uncharacterized protein n=1 Tax=Mikania micrantha TaxID=192012 RepID=A0A5N6LJN0_9ASTR|nr:hypothetical protein E3N88_41784 [Mikania micrantha]KAD4178882.1 hypothetical protein E3N88_27473 [Mikania micrantha]
MATEAPIKIGTKGTVGSLMMKEIEYFNRLEVHSQNHGLKVQEAAARSTGGQPKLIKIDSKSLPERIKLVQKVYSSVPKKPRQADISSCTYIGNHATKGA